MNGILVIDKPRSWTSHDVVSKARKVLREKRIGHTGTLDPLAGGVLVLCVGTATRIARYLEKDDKTYLAEMRLGVLTDTQDSDGRTIEVRAYAPPAQAGIERLFREFTGIVLQRPPAFSAVKVGGVASHRLARQGKVQEHAPRPVTIRSLELLRYEDPFLTFRVRCSKGTYVRTLCADMGERLGCGAHLTALTREQAGRFTLDDAISLEALEARARDGSAGDCLVAMNDALSGLPCRELTEGEAARISHGNPVPVGPLAGSSSAEGPIRLTNGRHELLAVGVVRNALLWPETVLT
jgi:tRNA pseudouridine55 synthase